MYKQFATFKRSLLEVAQRELAEHANIISPPSHQNGFRKNIRTDKYFKSEQMKTLYKNFKYFYFFLILATLATSPSAHAGLGRTIIDMLIDRIPFIGEAISEYRLEDKVDRIVQVQKTGLDQENLERGVKKA